MSSSTSSSTAAALVAQLNAAVKEMQRVAAAHTSAGRPVMPARHSLPVAAVAPLVLAAASAVVVRTPSVASVGGAAASTAAAASSATGPTPAGAKKRATVLEYIALNRNPGTRKAYGSSWAGFARYLEKHHIEEAKLDEYDVADYLRVRVEEQGVAAATLGNDRAAIADRLKNTDRKHVVHTSVVTDMMAVLRTQAAPSKPKQHMAAELMRELVETHDARGPSGRASAWLEERNIFLMLLMMMAFLREGEAVALTKADVDVKTLRVHGKLQQVLSIFIARSKTDQAKVGHVVLLGADEKNPACCPVKRFALYVEAVKASGVKSDMFFPTVAGTAMSPSTPCGIVQRAVKQANDEAEAGGFGVDRWGEPDSYGSHSLRRGGVTTARANGVSMLDIQKHGRWKSLVVFSYVGTTPAEQLAVTKSFLGEAKSVGEGAAAASAAPAPAAKDEVPSSQAHTLRAAAAAASGSGKAKSASAARGRKRAAEAEGEEDEKEEVTAVDEDPEDALFTAACSQGWPDPGEDEEEKVEMRPLGGRRAPSRAAKSVATANAKKKKKTQQ